MEKAARSLKIGLRTLKKCLIGGGVLLAAGAVAGNYISNKKKGEKYAPVAAPGEALCP